MDGSLDPTEDWSELWTEEQLKLHLGAKDPTTQEHVPFPFNGEGWYLLPGKTYLIAHTNLGKAPEVLYRVVCWERLGVNKMIYAIANAIVHMGKS